MLEKKNFLTLLVSDESAYQNCSSNSFLELALFLVRYEFILSEKKVGNNFSKRQIPPPGDISTKNPNGARYLDPKYSRWLSTDPALTSYVERKYDGPSGGIYNSVNLNLYHYGENNPIHIISRHTLRGLRSQVGYRSINELTKKTIFNPKWSDEKIFAAAGKVIKEAFEKGITNGEYTATVFGETITASINNGVVDTVYGTVKVTEEMLLK